MLEIMDLLKSLNSHMKDYGFDRNISLKGDNVEVTESEVVMKIPFIVTVKMPREKFEGSESDISHSISQAISQAVNLNK